MLGLNYFTAEEAEELRVNEIIEGDKECYPKAFSKILESLKARIEDLVLLKPLKNKGYNVEAFFPEDAPCHTVKGSISTPEDGFEATVITLRYGGVNVAGLQDESPWSLYVNRRDLQKFE